ncbi:MAG: hypothetical protein ABID87_08290 [Chloroflexota bacterium]
MKKIRKTYREVNPELLYAEIRDFALKQGVKLGEAKLETFTLPDQSASFVTRGTLTFTGPRGAGGSEAECLRAHVVGSVRDETKLMLDIEEKSFPAEKLAALQEDIDFIFGAHEAKS